MFTALRIIAVTFTTSMIAICGYCLYVMAFLLVVAPDPALDTIRQVVAVQMVCGIAVFTMLTYRAIR